MERYQSIHKAIDGTYVYQMKEGGIFSKGGPKIEKVPGTPKEALSSDLMSFMEKRRCQKFFTYVANYDPKNPKTFEGMDLKTLNFKALIKKFDLEDNTVDFLGHAVALYTNDDFINRPAIECIKKIKVYMDSVGRYGDSPFIYPVYGLGGIPEGFSRMAAVNGSTFMLNADVDEFIIQDGNVVGMKSAKVKELMGLDQINCKMLICDPSYLVKTPLNTKLQKIGRVVRCICIVDHPIPHTKDVPSIQIIIP